MSASAGAADVGLAQLRQLVDATDGALLLLVRARRDLVRLIAQRKRRCRLPAGDPVREAQVRQHARRWGHQLALDDDLAIGLVDLLIASARHDQGLPAPAPIAPTSPSIESAPMRLPSLPALASDPAASNSTSWLRWLPPPRRLAPLLRRLPAGCHASLLQTMLRRHLLPLLQSGDLDFLRGRRLAIEVDDLGLAWVLSVDGEALQVAAGSAGAEAGVAASLTDLLALAARLADADTLFFQRRLRLTGDTELGLTARNLLDRLPWEQLPLGPRILLQRGARFATAARAAYRARAAAQQGASPELPP